jgi:flagellar hook-basal body complex protein FliE
MSQIDVNSVLLQLRQLGSQATSMASETPIGMVGSAAASTGGLDFGSLLKRSVAAVADSQSAAQTQVNAFERGDPGADIGSTVIAGQKADLSFRALVQVRNKLTDAYTNIMNMPV